MKRLLIHFAVSQKVNQTDLDELSKRMFNYY